MAISAVGSVHSTNKSSGTNPLSVAAFAFSAIGDAAVVFSTLSGSATVSSISHPGVTTWTKLVSGANGTTSTTEIWWGVITALTSGALTVTYSSSTGSATAAVQQFNSSVSGTWTADTSTGTGTSSGSSGNFPSITPQAADTAPLYLGAAGYGTMAGGSGSTTGFVYTPVTSSASGHELVVYNVAPGTGASSPNWTVTSNSTALALVDGFLYVATGATSHANFIPLLAA